LKPTLYHGDCLVEMDKIPDGSVDLVLADPPYGTTACKWDSIIDLDAMWLQLKRVVKGNGAIVLMGSQPFTTKLINSNMKWFKYCWVWDKHIARGFQNARHQPMNKHEDVLVFGCGKIEYNPQKTPRDKPVAIKNYQKNNNDSTLEWNKKGTSNNGKTYIYTDKNPDSIIVGKWMANGGKVHPTQKPVALMQYLIKTYTNETETVLDFTMGSGTTGVACKNTNRKFIGIELDKTYFNIATNRINTHQVQKELAIV